MTSQAHLFVGGLSIKKARAYNNLGLTFEVEARLTGSFSSSLVLKGGPTTSFFNISFDLANMEWSGTTIKLFLWFDFLVVSVEDIKPFNRPSLREGRAMFVNPLSPSIDKVILLVAVVVVDLVVDVVILVVVVLDVVVDGVVLVVVVVVIAFGTCLLIRDKFSARLLSGWSWFW